jgi:hypothetical protein
MTRPTPELLLTARRQRASLVAIDNLSTDRLAELFDQPLPKSVLLAVHQAEESLLEGQAATSHGPGKRSLKLLLRQKLAFRVCDGCRQAAYVSSSDLNLLKESGLENKDSHYFQGGGCERCGGSGIAGRIPIFEAVRVNRELLEALKEGPAQRNKALRANTVHSYQDYARALIAQGTIDPTEGLRLFPPASSSFSLPT